METLYTVTERIDSSVEVCIVIFVGALEIPVQFVLSTIDGSATGRQPKIRDIK